jgi:uncharacterized membrane protein YgcG
MPRLVHHLLFAWVFFLALAGRAQAVYPPDIADGAKFFKEETLAKANQKIRSIYEKYRVDVVVETFAAVPPEIEKKYKEAESKELFVQWARERAEKLGVHGVYILVCRKPAHLHFHIDPETRKKAITFKDRDRIAGRMLEQFREREFDEGLLAALDQIAATLKNNLK